MIDTNVLIGAMLSADGANRKVVRACLNGQIKPLIGQALLSEYEDVLSRQQMFRDCVLSSAERDSLLDALLSVSQWIKIYFSWRPNLADEAGNHLIELAVAGSADCIVSHNYKHLSRPELRFPGIGILSPAALMKELQ